MKKFIRYSLILLAVSIFISCGKEKKPEFTDDDTGQKTLETRKEEQKQEVKQDKTADTNSQSRNNKTQDYKSNNFESEKPVAVISPLEAGDYNGKTVTVKGFVADIYQSEKVAYLNFVQKYPNNPFTAVIFASKFTDFPDIIKYKNKNVEVTGRVSMYREKPQIILNSTKQIVVK